MTTSSDITVNGIDITVHSDGSISKLDNRFNDKRIQRSFGSKSKNGTMHSSIGKHPFQVHRLVAQAFLADFLDFPDVDHIDGDKANNEVSNLRMATRGDNLRAHQNTRKGGSSQYRGVSWHKENGKWRSQCTVNYKQKNLGLFTTEVDAALARDAYVFSQGFPLEGLNFPDCFRFNKDQL
tara:strand:+ start:583 stop:1122 length:540 start_codon:yes stop_codon:yes gene_type:complete